MTMVNGIAQEFWSEVFDLHAQIDEYPRPKGSKPRSKKVRRVIARDTRLGKAS